MQITLYLCYGIFKSRGGISCLFIPAKFFTVIHFCGSKMVEHKQFHMIQPKSYCPIYSHS